MSVNGETGEPRILLPTTAEILDALGRTGFLLEQRVAQVFEEKGFEVELNHPYSDSATEKSREIDIYAAMGDFAGDSGAGAPFVDSQYFVECKNTSDPLLVIGATGASSRYHANTFRASLDPLTLGWEGAPRDAYWFLHFGRLPGSPDEVRFCGNQLVRMNRHSGRWRADNSGIFDGVAYPLAKVAQGVIEAEDPRPDDDLSATYSLIFCLLVTSGPLYAVEVGADGSEVRQVEWTRFNRLFSGDGLRGNYLFEVVQFEYLAQYLDQVTLAYYRGVLERLVQNSRIFNPRWLLKQYGEPRDREMFDRWLSYYDMLNGTPSNA